MSATAWGPMDLEPSQPVAEPDSPPAVEATPVEAVAIEATAVEAANEGADSPQLKTEEIARLAYSYWEARGCQDGSADEDWFRAEKELRARG